MTYNEALRRITELKRGINDPFSITERSEIESLYYAVLGRHVRTCNCMDKWHDAIVEMLYYLKKNGKMKEKSKYILRAGVVIQPADGNVYTNDNLTDDIAETFIKDRPNARGLFEVIPDAIPEPSDSTESEAFDANALRIAELESENAELKAKIAEYESDKIDELSDTAEDAEPEQTPNASLLNATILSTVAEALASGKSKSAIKSELAGSEIDGVKLTVRLVASYIKAVEGKVE